MTAWPHQNDANEYYGDPRTQDGTENSTWVSQNIVRIPAPWQLITAWNSQPVQAIRIHKKCADSLKIVLEEIWNNSGKNEDKIKEWGMNLYSGAYHFKPMTNNKKKLSMHAYGCAVDFDSSGNFFGDTTPNFAHIDPVLNAFASEGWVWGGNWSTPDGMHWQAARLS